MKSSMFLLSIPALLAGSAQAQFSSSHTAPQNRSRIPRPLIANPPPAPLVGGSDSCMTPDVITGTGAFAFDNSIATTGTEGQTTVNCIQFNMIGIPNDVWFTWTAPQTGRVLLADCGLTTVDTKIAVYPGTTCPASGSTATACNDDMTAFSLASQLFFNVTAGQQFLIQVGISPAPPPATPGVGTFSIDYLSDTCMYDDGSTEQSIGLTNGGETGWMQRLGSIGATTTVTAISTAWGNLGGAGQAPPAGSPATVEVWNDPNNDGNPSDAVLITAQATTVQNPGTDMLQTVTLTTPVTLSGVFFIGASVAHAANQFVTPMDENGCGYRPGVAWIVGAPGGVLDLNTLTNNGVPPLAFDNLVLGGVPQNCVLLLQATCNSGGPVTIGTPFCLGDGSATGCPCANNSAVGSNTGCLNSLGNGGKLEAMGTPSIANDTVVLQGSLMPNSSALYFQGTTQQNGGLGSTFGDGLRCAGGAVTRLGTQTNVAGSSVYPAGAQLHVSVKGTVTSPGVRTYQAWYRNAAVFCTPSTFNLTNGLQITWTP